MNKKEFLDILQARLAGLPQEDVKRSLEFYGEMIDDRTEEGMDEQQAVKEIGSVDEVVAQILSETPLQRLIKEKAKPSRTLRAWEIALLALGSPIWASLLLAAACIFFSVYILIWSLVLVIYCVRWCGFWYCGQHNAPFHRESAQRTPVFWNRTYLHRYHHIHVFCVKGYNGGYCQTQ